MPCSNNGNFPASDLADIPGPGRLEKSAAAAWNAPGGPADHGLYALGDESAYRDLAYQWVAWNNYLHGGNLAAYPGTSEHGCGKAVDLAATWMRAWIDEHGAQFGWRKTEAFSEWWHVNFVGGVGPFPPPFKPLHPGSYGKRVRKYSRRLAYIRRSKKVRRERRPHRIHYIKKPRRRFDKGMETAVIIFQRDHGLKPDGVIGPRTARAITAVFRRQWDTRH